MPATLEDYEVELLESYLQYADELLQIKTAREGVPCSFEIKIRDGQVAAITSEVPTDEEIASLLHRLRPFILAEEPTSYLKVSALLGRRFEYGHFREILKEQRQLFDGRNNQELFQVTSKGAVINSERTLQDWLNGYEYHRDPGRRQRIESLHNLVSIEQSKAIFVGLLSDKVQAIFQLAAVIAVILGRESTIAVKRHGSRADLSSSKGTPADPPPYDDRGGG